MFQKLHMETWACFVNRQEFTLWEFLQTLTADKYAIKTPQGVWAVH